MDFVLSEINIDDIRKNCIIDYLNIFRKDNKITNTNIFLTGKTNSGKTTFENLLIAKEHFVEDSMNDTTQTVQQIQFFKQLNFFDLPGIRGEAEFENMNRACLRLDPLEDTKPIEKIPVLKATFDGKLANENVVLRADEFAENPLFEPHLVFYIIATNSGIGRETDYITQILKKWKVIFIVNEFANVNSKATASDIQTKLVSLHGKSGTDQEINIIQVDCKSGRGLEQVFDGAGRLLGKDKGALISRIFWHQYVHTPLVFKSRVTDELIKASDYISGKKPVSPNEDKFDLKLFSEKVFEFIAAAKEKLNPDFQQKINKLNTELLNGIFSDMNAYCTKSEDVPRYRPGKQIVNGEEIDVPILDHIDKRFSYLPYGKQGKSLVFLMVIYSEILQNFQPEFEELQQLFTAIILRFQTDNQMKKAYQLNFMDRVISQLLSSPFKLVSNDLKDIESYIEDFVTRPYIFYFKASDNFLISSMGTKLNWRTENADNCMLELNGGENELSVPKNKKNHPFTSTQNAVLKLFAKNENGNTEAALQIKFFETPTIKMLDMSPLYFALNPVSFINPTFNLSNKFSNAIHIGQQVKYNPQNIKKSFSLAVPTSPALQEELAIFHIWKNSFVKYYQSVLAYAQAQKLHIKTQSFKSYQDRNNGTKPNT